MTRGTNRILKLSNAILLILLVVCSHTTFAQTDPEEDSANHIDSSQAVSPLFMPVFYDCPEPHFYRPLEKVPVDTSLHEIHQYDPVWQDHNIYQTLGIGAQAHKAINYDYVRRPGFSLITLPYSLYHKEQHELKLYDVKTSFTHLRYTYGITTENEFDAVHAQHRGNLDLAFNIHGYSNAGYFTYQKANDMSADALVHYEIPSKIYGFRVSYIFNRTKLEENAGLLNMEDFTQQIAANLVGYNMKLYNASSLVSTHDLLFQHYVNIRDAQKRYYGTLTHAVQYKYLKSSYFDIGLDSTYYQPTFLWSPDTTHDTLLCHQWINTIQWSNFSPFDKQSNKNYFFHIAGGIMHEYVLNYLALPRQLLSVSSEDPMPIFPLYTTPDSLLYHKGKPTYQQNSITPFARTHVRLFGIMDIYAGISYTFMGYTKHDAIANVAVSWAISRPKRHYLSLHADFYRVQPDYIYSYYAGNHRQWALEWKKQNVMKLTAAWRLKQYKVAVTYFMLDHFMQLDQNYMPFVSDKMANVLQVNLSAPLRVKGFGANADLYVQYSDNKELSLPIFAGKASAFYLFKLFHRKMQLQVGADVMYNTAYYADAYYPLLHQFYHQESCKVGNFVYLNAHVNIRVQRVSIFARLGNILSGIKIKKVFAYSNYFTTPYYPMQSMNVAIGVNWRFYD